MTIPMSRFQRAVTWLAMMGAMIGSLTAQVTESPQTVAPGKFRVEMDGLKLSMDRADAAGNTYSAVGIASTVVSTGLTKDFDVQVGFDLFHRETIESNGARDSNSGLGDLRLRVKWTFWRDDDFGAAAAVIPYIKVPTNRDSVGNGSVEGGIIVPWGMDIGGGLRSGAMFQWDVARNDADNGYDSHWSASGFVQQDLVLGITLYGEATLQVASTGLSDWAGMVGAGALWNLSERIQLDYELLRGLNAQASEWTHVLRVNWEW